MFLLICKLYICIQNVFGHILYRSRIHWNVNLSNLKYKKLAYMLTLAAVVIVPYV